MRGSSFFLLVVAAAAAIALLAYRNWKKERQRRDLLFVWATNSGYTFSVEDDSWCERWQGAPFDQGDHRRARNVVTGRLADFPLTAFDYSFETHSSDGRGSRTTTTHRFAVAALQLPGYLPTLQVTPENLLTRIGNAIGLDDVELESEEFNRAFRVHATDRKFASDVLTPRTMEFLLTRRDFSWRIEGADIIGWQNGEMTPAVAVAMSSTLQRVATGIPSFVWKDHS
ncbi:MAG TPA: DUF3137 domain-containing protein [Mycobacteriales bacterium]|nr:DUF3137 domain-containing protein [Mycobacteriales bacterium]